MGKCSVLYTDDEMICKFCKSKNTRKHGLIKQNKNNTLYTYQRVECLDCCKNHKGVLLKKEPITL